MKKSGTICGENFVVVKVNLVDNFFILVTGQAALDNQFCKHVLGPETAVVLFLRKVEVFHKAPSGDRAASSELATPVIFYLWCGILTSFDIPPVLSYNPGGDFMTKEYLFLFNAVTDAILALESLRAELMAAQQTAEEIYVESED